MFGKIFDLNFQPQCHHTNMWQFHSTRSTDLMFYRRSCNNYVNDFTPQETCVSNKNGPDPFLTNLKLSEFK